ncbi:hypothetical protein H3H12_07555 [Serratia marcescens]|uniref:hypothetical protein n=1 Tax=Serratia TaxID=613 RepID=UPI001182596A|nr:hypothetical protein [Serratia marcescens]MBN3902117.1 hypothetical protein [Serratia marcescens]MBN3913622.1 hypothetical protein [Serratia marcescens]MBN3918105.1 hypothetical protein [Serratia marcescens]MBN3934805.1 hypothetical protein [Serratia marcescens]MBN3955022.1 hypothetical protein [Serratia marcescens]
MKKVLSALTLCFLTSFFANAITLDAYLKNHKDIEEDPILSEYVRKWAWFMALMDSQQKYNTSDSTKINELLSAKGERYGALSIRKLSTDCKNGTTAAGGIELNKRECKILINSANK